MAYGATQSIKLLNAQGVAAAGYEIIPTAESEKNTRCTNADDAKYGTYAVPCAVDGSTYYLTKAGATEFGRLPSRGDWGAKAHQVLW